MNPETEVARLLEANGAQLIRHKKHPIYRLDNGAQFVQSSTPGDHRAAQQSLSQLRRVLGLTGQPKGAQTTVNLDNTGIPESVRFLLQKSGAIPAPHISELAFILPNGHTFTANKMKRFDPQAHASQLQRLEALLAKPKEMPPPVQPSAPAPTPPAPPALPGILERLNARIAAEEAAQEKLINEAGVHEKLANALKALREPIEAMGDPAHAEAILGAILAPPPPPAAPPPPPQVITERQQVTRQLVFAATQVLAGEFKIDDVVGVMTQGKVVDDAERVRIRGCVAQMLTSMVERGEVVKTQAGLGKRPVKFRKAAPDAYERQHIPNPNGTALQHVTR